MALGTTMLARERLQGSTPCPAAGSTRASGRADAGVPRRVPRGQGGARCGKLVAGSCFRSSADSQVGHARAPSGDLAFESGDLRLLTVFISLRSVADTVPGDVAPPPVGRLQAFLLELGHGLAFVGGSTTSRSTVRTSASARCSSTGSSPPFVVVELKAVRFRPELTGQVDFYAT